MRNLKHARRNWRCYSLRGFAEGHEHLLIILQTKALIIEEMPLKLVLNASLKQSRACTPHPRQTTRTETKHCSICSQLNWQLSRRLSALIFPSCSSATLISNQKCCISLCSAGLFRDVTVHISKHDTSCDGFISAHLQFFFFFFKNNIFLSAEFNFEKIYKVSCSSWHHVETNNVTMSLFLNAFLYFWWIINVSMFTASLTWLVSFLYGVLSQLTFKTRDANMWTFLFL